MSDLIGKYCHYNMTVTSKSEQATGHSFAPKKEGQFLVYNETVMLGD